jgi:hypothetical protein
MGWIQRLAATAGAMGALMLIMASAASAQTYYQYEYRVTQDQYVIPTRVGSGGVYVVDEGPATVCGDPQAFRQMLIARANGNIYRASTILAQSCTREPVETRLLVTGAAQTVAVWNRDTPDQVTYRVVPVHVLNGPDRGTDGYMLVSGLQ